MARIGWAYVNCSEGGGQAAGPTGSLQFLTGTNATSGSANLRYFTASYAGYEPGTMMLTGTLLVSGTISASHYHIEDVAQIDATGSTYFGNTNDDMHYRTGSLLVSRDDGTVFFRVNNSSRQTHVEGFVGGYATVSSTPYSTSVLNYIVGVGATGDVVINLHSAASAGAGSLMVIKDQVVSRGGNSIYISASTDPAETIDGSGWYELTGTMPAISLYSNGSNWFVF